MILKKWNETVFIQKGFQAWLELPSDEKKASKKFRLLIVPNNDMNNGQSDVIMAPTNMGIGTGAPAIPSIIEADGAQYQRVHEADSTPFIAEAPTNEFDNVPAGTSPTSPISPVSPMTASTGLSSSSPVATKAYADAKPGETVHELA